MQFFYSLSCKFWLCSSASRLYVGIFTCMSSRISCLNNYILIIFNILRVLIQPGYIESHSYILTFKSFVTEIVLCSLLKYHKQRKLYYHKELLISWNRQLDRNSCDPPKVAAVIRRCFTIAELFAARRAATPTTPSLEMSHKQLCSSLKCNTHARIRKWFQDFHVIWENEVAWNDDITICNCFLKLFHCH